MNRETGKGMGRANFGRRADLLIPALYWIGAGCGHGLEKLLKAKGRCGKSVAPQNQIRVVSHSCYREHVHVIRRELYFPLLRRHKGQG